MATLDKKVKRSIRDRKMNLSLSEIGFRTNGKVRHGYVTCPGPEVPNKRGWKARRIPSPSTLTKHLMERLGVNGHHDSHTNKMELLRWAEGMCGITWKPQPKKSKAPRPQARHKTHNQFFGETLAILRWHLDDGLEITLE